MSLRERLLRQHGGAHVPLPPLPPPIPWPTSPLTVERYWRCRGCDVTWQGTSPACWCWGEVAA